MIFLKSCLFYNFFFYVVSPYFLKIDLEYTKIYDGAILEQPLLLKKLFKFFGWKGVTF